MTSHIEYRLLAAPTTDPALHCATDPATGIVLLSARIDPYHGWTDLHSDVWDIPTELPLGSRCSFAHLLGSFAQANRVLLRPQPTTH